MIKSKNKFNHKWVDDGGKRSPIYCYTCSKCGLKRIKNDFVSSSYFTNEMIYISNKAPDCIK